MSGDNSIIEVQELEKMAGDKKEQWERRSIYKLPACVTKINKNAYTPQMVSFGPYHHGNENLMEMESQKERAVDQFLKRYGVNYDDCRESLSKVVGDLMDAYDWQDPKLNTDAFLEIMIRDGIFMLEILGSWGKNVSGYADNDPIFSTHGNVFFKPHIKRDMLILENQIPIRVLHELYLLQYRGEKYATKVGEKDATKVGEKDEKKVVDANEVVFEFFFPEKFKTAMPVNSLHVLDMYRTVILGSFPPSKGEEEESEQISGGGILRSIVQLNDAGVKIKKSRTSGLRDISFKNGILRLPVITVDDTSESLFLNLIAYERFHIVAGNDVSNFVFFMDNLIDNESDIELLSSYGIMQNGIGSDIEAVKFFKSLSRGISLDRNSSVSKIYNNLNVYSKNHWFRSEFCGRYCRSPWASISFLAGTFFLVQSLADSTFGILDYFKRN